MTDHGNLIKELAISNQSKILFFIMDGIGGLQTATHPGTELELAKTPNLDKLSQKSSCGLLIPVGHGITAGSGPGHFALFGHDPITSNIGRGVLEAAGICFKLTENDVVARGNFSTIDEKGLIIDRRAGRISDNENKRLCKLLNEKINLNDVELFVEPVKGHRFIVVFRASGLEGEISDTDPQKTGVTPLAPQALNPAASNTVEKVKEFINQAASILSIESQANMLTLRGFGKYRNYPTMQEHYKLKSLCLANYPMYRGVCSLLGMDINPITPDIPSQFDALEKEFSNYDFIFLHVKTTDVTGEDGDFKAKVEAIEKLDSYITRLEALNFDVLVITGDHSTPSALKSHSWHPVPVLLHSQYARLDSAKRFTEIECLKGALGQLPAHDLMSLSLAHALRLKKFGA